MTKSTKSQVQSTKKNASKKRHKTIARYRVADGISHREIEGQTLLLASGESSLLTLNRSGQFIWQRLAARQDLDAIARAFQRAFRVSADIADTDVRAFVSMLAARKFIRRG